MAEARQRCCLVAGVRRVWLSLPRLATLHFALPRRKQNFMPVTDQAFAVGSRDASPHESRDGAGQTDGLPQLRIRRQTGERNSDAETLLMRQRIVNATI